MAPKKKNNKAKQPIQKEDDFDLDAFLEQEATASKETAEPVEEKQGESNKNVEDTPAAPSQNLDDAAAAFLSSLAPQSSGGKKKNKKKPAKAATPAATAATTALNAFLR